MRAFKKESLDGIAVLMKMNDVQKTDEERIWKEEAQKEAQEKKEQMNAEKAK